MKWLRVVIGFSDESFNGEAELVFTAETGAAQCLAGQETEPDFHLIEPTGGSGSEMKLNAASIFIEPVRIPLMRAVVI